MVIHSIYLGSLFKKNIIRLTLVTLAVFYLYGCASSYVTHDVTSNIDQGVQNTRDLYRGTTEGTLADSYQNSSQQAKGMLIGGGIGALTGAAFSSAIGIIPGTAAGIIFGGSYGAYIDANMSLKDKLINRGITVIVLGDQVLMVIPSARIFHALTPVIKPDAYSTLTMVAAYINHYDKELVKISAYTNAVDSERAALALSQQQAVSIAKFLTATGMDARLLYAEGYGGTHLVERNSSLWDGNDNYRIEITFEKLYA